MKKPSPAVCKYYKTGYRTEKIEGKTDVCNHIKKSVYLTFYKKRN